MAKGRSFRDWFSDLTGHDSPRGWQEALAAEGACRSRVIRVPTGFGKTQGVLAAWSFYRVSRDDATWPRRLVWCLPMRVLVEQTEHVARELVARMPQPLRPDVYVAMGGEDSGEWFLYPERPAIIVGTQDMLLSRGLNRGYASGRARWPVEFGLLNQDVLWVMDEVQLMDVGLATSVQLQAFRDDDSRKGLRPCFTWWMSATLQAGWLSGVDTADHHAGWTRQPVFAAPAERVGGLWDVPKPLATVSTRPDDAGEFARKVLEEHASLGDGGFGRITLVVCNTVRRACETFDALKDAGRFEGLELVHSRFRPAERQAWRERFLGRCACSPGTDRIVVATQVVEAGVDISAGCLVTELAPWPSLVQRFGRCARYGGDGRVIVVDRGRTEKSSAPYSADELESAWGSLRALRDVGIGELERYEDSLDPDARARLYPYSPPNLLLRREYEELFDTTPDLTGADLDVSRFIRSGDERDVQVYWVDLDPSESPSDRRRPRRHELCGVPFLDARDWLCGKETESSRKPRLLRGRRAWVWDWIEGGWSVADRAGLVPGRVVCVASESGGYRLDRGFDRTSREPVPEVPRREVARETDALDSADDRQDGEELSFNPWKTIACHAAEVASLAGTIAEAVGLPAELKGVLTTAAIWHDWGKSHAAFQGALRSADRPARSDLAKGPAAAWLRPPGTYRFQDDSDDRPAFRHELASALGLFAILEAFAPSHPALLGPWAEAFSAIGLNPPPSQPDSRPPPAVRRVLGYSAASFDLLAYLVASHHGKVRATLHAAPKDQEYRDRDGRGLPIRGVREGDRLPPVVIVPGEPPAPELALTLEPAALGLSPRTGASWRERCDGLLGRFGPAGLAFLEALLRAADVRASRATTDDPSLCQGAPV